MSQPEPPATPSRLDALIGQVVVVDLASPFVCLGTLLGADASFLDLADADLHDLRDSPATREIYVFESARFGVRQNRARVLIRLDQVIAIARFADVGDA